MLVIVDLNHGNKSVTNDIENVLKELNVGRLISTDLVVYKDSDGYYDRVLVYPNGLFRDFERIGSMRRVNDLFDVIKILQNKNLLK